MRLIESSWPGGAAKPVMGGGILVALVEPIVDTQGAQLGADPLRPEVSVVIPCLNEEAAIVQTVEQARLGLADAGLTGEVVVVDNASEDRSAELARAAGARV